VGSEAPAIAIGAALWPVHGRNRRGVETDCWISWGWVGSGGAAMGRLFLMHLEGNIYSCKHCKTHLGLSGDIISKVRPSIPFPGWRNS
jgi:hypothetical protein